jgi:hypothetical protein
MFNVYFVGLPKILAVHPPKESRYKGGERDEIMKPPITVAVAQYGMTLKLSL